MLVVTDPSCTQAVTSLPGAVISSRYPGQWEILLDTPEATTFTLSIT